MTALITPFRNGEVDTDALNRLIEFQIANGTSAIVPCGTTGEAATLSHREHAEIIRFVARVVHGRVPVIAGTGSNSTAEAIELTGAAKEAGASAALLIAPYYNKPTQEGIYQHYRAIAEATRFPLILYNIPSRTGVKIEAATIARLAELEYVVGLKEATGSLDEVQECIRRTEGRLDIYSGDDSLTLPIIAVGGTGVISVVANVMPRQTADLVRAAIDGDYATARRLHFRMLPLIRALFLETNPIPVKAALAMMEYCHDELRLPLVPMSDPARAVLRGAMQEVGLL